MSSVRTPLTKLAAVTAAALLILTGCASGPDVTPTGETTEVTVKVEGMRFVPDSIDVPVGNKLVIDFKNTGMVVHDLVLANGAGSDQLNPGESQKIDAGVIDEDTDGWCSVSNHRALGMVMKVNAVKK
ncbi:cupredoxin domain-containing protein [uncultured Microbacterium sp.]|uniref:cupredoxin domain-containing protein n=1 Tax=uncultured Microbacterium sp. TaxID=191216 RepID=UPI0026261FF6|nr:cupredoxin domain-containing protein [uncultured Microbacterium sp.]